MATRKYATVNDTQGKQMSNLNEIELGQLCRTASNSFHKTEFGLSSFPRQLKDIIRHRAWERRHLVTPDGTPRTGVSGGIVELGSLRELITTKPLKGWGETPEAVEAVIRDDSECLLLFREEMKQKAGRKPKECHDNVMALNPTSHGNSKSYSLARVLKSCDEETIAEVMAGELSANAALIAAGVRRRMLQVPADDYQAAQEKLNAHYGVTETFTCKNCGSIGHVRIGQTTRHGSFPAATMIQKNRSEPIQGFDPAFPPLAFCPRRLPA